MKNEIDSYGFTWPGKIESLIEAGRPTDKTLRPILQDSVNFDSTENIYIEGDNLDALKIILKSYMRRVKMIYIDPPYNTGSDFVFRDDFSQSEEESQRSLGFEDDAGRNYSSEIYRNNKKSNPRFHSEWCSMIYPRLKLAHMLLSDDGVIFISIDDNEQAKLRMICDEIFGENNFVACLVWDLGTGTTAGHFARGHEYILVFAKNKSAVSNFTNYEEGQTIIHGALKKISHKNPASEITFPAGFEYDGGDAVFTGEIGDAEKIYILSDEMRFKDGRLVKPVTVKAGFAMRNQVLDFIAGKEVHDTKGQKVRRFFFNARGVLFYEKEKTIINPKTVLSGIANTRNGTNEINEIFGGNYFSFPKPVSLIQYLAQLATTPDSIILDFFAGSSTTAHAVMSLNAQDSGHRKFIMIQIAEPCPEKSEARKAGYATISQIGRERIRRAGENLMCDNQQLTTNNYTLDIGFRAFRVEPSNYRNIFMYPDELSQENISDMADNIKHDRSDMDLLFMCAANFGLPLSLPYHTEIVDGFTVHIYGDNDIAACFGENISEEAVKFVAKLKAGHSVFRESCFDGVCSRINLEQIFDAYSDGKKMTIL